MSSLHKLQYYCFASEMAGEKVWLPIEIWNQNNSILLLRYSTPYNKNTATSWSSVYPSVSPSCTRWIFRQRAAGHLRISQRFFDGEVLLQRWRHSSNCDSDSDMVPSLTTTTVYASLPVDHNYPTILSFSFLGSSWVNRRVSICTLSVALSRNAGTVTSTVIFFVNNASPYTTAARNINGWIGRSTKHFARGSENSSTSTKSPGTIVLKEPPYHRSLPRIVSMTS